MHRRMLGVVSAVVFGVSGLGSTARAQITFTPYAGSFYSAGKLIDLPAGNVAITAKQSNTAVYGARLTVPVGQVLAVEGAVGFASSNVLLVVPNSCGLLADTTSHFDCSQNFKGNLLLGSARLQFRPRRSNVHLMIGGAMIRHGGKAWGDSAHTNYGALVGIEVRASVTPQLPLVIGAEGYFYSFDADESGTTFKNKTQADLLFTVGVPIKLGH